MVRLLTVMAAALLIGGCVLPVNEEKPFQQKHMPDLAPGVSSRLDVLDALGTPNRVFDDERLFLYSEMQTHAFFFFSYCATCGGVIQTRHFLAATFDDAGRLSHLEAIPLSDETEIAVRVREGDYAVRLSKRYCFATGVCIADDRAAVLYAPPDGDGAAAAPPPGHCNLFVYGEKTPSSPWHFPTGIFLDRRLIGQLTQDAYYRLAVSEGRHRIDMMPGLALLSAPDGDIINDSLAVDCSAGKPIFVHLAVSPPESFMYRFALRRVDREVGTAAIAARSRLMRQWRAKNFGVASR